MTVRKRLLEVLAHAAARRPWTVVSITFAVVALSLVALLLRGLEVETSRVALWPADHPLQKRFQEYQDNFGSPFQLIVVVSGEDPDRNKTVADRVAAGIRAEVPEIRDVFYRIDLDALKQHGLFYLDRERLDEMVSWAEDLAADAGTTQAEPVSLGGFVGVLEKLNEQLAALEEGDTSGLSAVEKRADSLIAAGESALSEIRRWIDDPERRDFDVMRDLGGAAGGGDGLDADGYLVADKGRMVVLLAQPSRNDDSLAYQAPLVAGVQAIADREAAAAQGVEIGLTGMPAFAVEEMRAANHDLSAVTLISAVGVLLLFLLGYGSLLNTLFVALTLLCGVIVDLALTAVLIGHVNLISSLFVAVLLGLGIDYGIQLINRFQEERGAGVDPREAVHAAVVRTGEGVMTGGVTTAVAFFTMALGDFLPLRELGLVAGAGILLILASSFVVLPAFLVLRSRRGGDGRARGLLAGRWSLPVLPLRGRKAALVPIVVALVATTLLALAIRPIRFSNDLISMLPPEASSVQWLKRLEKSGMFTSAFNASIADSIEEVERRAEAFGKLETVSRVRSVETFLPRDQAEKLPLVRRTRAAWKRAPELTLTTPVVDVPAFLEQLEELEGYLELDLPLTLKTNGLERLLPGVKKLAAGVKDMRAAAAALPADELATRLGRLQTRSAELLGDLRRLMAGTGEEVTAADLPADIRGLVYKETEAGPRYLIQVYPAGDINDDEFMPRFLAETRSVDPDITGYPVNYYEFALVMQENFRVAFLYAAVAIVLLLLLDFRRLRDVALALLPLTMGGVCMVGTMNVVGIDYNLANIMAIPLIVGIGVAYGVYVIHRAREDVPPRPRRVVASTGKAVLFSALTTMVSFGAMSTASHRGAAGLGLTLLLGIGFCLVMSIGVLPALLRLLPVRTRNR